MKKQLIIRINPDGTINSETKNIKGKSCEKYIGVIEKLTEAKTVDSDYTDEFYEIENQITSDNIIKQETSL
ncbi:MAG: DUF2997 domain-containing protein [Clostridia bacterium]|nr:DUF2997 domain-containing protein [Clostridia bacterium]